MDPALSAHATAPAEGDPLPGSPGDAPLALVVSLALPVFAVLVWFMVRLFSGRWITDPAPPLVPPLPWAEDDGTDPAGGGRVDASGDAG